MTSLKKGQKPKLKPNQLNIHGKKFEKLTNSVFHPLRLQLPIKWERIVDSAAAGNFIEARASDFELSVKSGQAGQPYRFLIECKASDQEATFAKCFKSLIKKKQLPKMRLAVRAGAIGLYFFHSVKTGEIEIWDFSQVKKAYYAKRTKFEDVPRYVVTVANFPIFARRVCQDPARFVRDILGG